MGPPLSARQLPWALVLLGSPMLVLGIVTVMASIGVLPSEWAATIPAEVILFGVGLPYVGGGLGLIWKHSRLVPGTPEYTRLHEQRDWHPHVTEGAIAYWVGFGALLAGLTLLGLAEGAQGACYRGSPNPCQFSLSPSAGLEFWGTLALVVCPIWFVGYGSVKFVGWLRRRQEEGAPPIRGWNRRRRDEKAVRAWLDGKGPLK